MRRALSCEGEGSIVLGAELREFPEPLGLLGGRDAAEAVAADQARPLLGGPTAFALVRIGGQVLPALHAPEVLSAAVAPWGGVTGPALMGILNVTPDSFSDGGDRLDPGVAIAAGERMLADGADLLDVGGESTRPGAVDVPPEEEQSRILPVIAALARLGAVISVDTRNAGTMVRALDAGARIVNDVSALRHDPESLGVVAARRCPVVLMHMRGNPGTMGEHAVYADVASEVAAELGERARAAMAAGVAAANIIIDPGFGFAKTAGQDMELLRRLGVLANLGHPIMVGISRKRSIGVATGERRLKHRVAGSVAAALAALDRGAQVVRVHDVAETRQAMRLRDAVLRGST